MQTGVSSETASGSTPVAMPPQTAPAPQRIGVPREIFPGEKRVATVPEVVEKLIKLGFKVVVESGAGDLANFADDTYRAAGADVVEGAAALWAASDIVFKVREPGTDEVALMHEGQTLSTRPFPVHRPPGASAGAPSATGWRPPIRCPFRVQPPYPGQNASRTCSRHPVTCAAHPAPTPTDPDP